MQSLFEKNRSEVLAWLHHRLSADTFRVVATELEAVSEKDSRDFVHLLREAKIEVRVLRFLKRTLPQEAYVQFVRTAYLWEKCPPAGAEGGWALD